MSKFITLLILSLLGFSTYGQLTTGNSAPNLPAVISTQDTNTPSPIVAGTVLRTEWRSVRNPFKADVRAHVDTVEKVEQVKVIGISHMPDEKGIMRTYAFLTKLGDQDEEVNAKGKAKKASGDIMTLQAFPEILDEATQPAIEDLENSSFRLGNETLWFLGCYATSNRTVAVFWPMSSYPVKEETLKSYDVADTLDTIHSRKTIRGEKIASTTPLTLLPSPKQDTTETNSTINSKPVIIGKLPDSPNVPPSKATPITGDLLIDVDRALHSHQTEFSTNNTSVKPYY